MVDKHPELGPSPKIAEDAPLISRYEKRVCIRVLIATPGSSDRAYLTVGGAGGIVVESQRILLLYKDFLSGCT